MTAEGFPTHRRSVHEAPSPPGAVVPGRALALLTVLAVALGAAFVLAPARLAAAGTSDGGLADQRNLVGALRAAFVDYWNSGERALSPDMARVVDYWFRFHVAKGVISAVLLLVLIALGTVLWKAFLKSGDVLAAGGRIALASAGTVVAALAFFSLLALMANTQGALAPLSSVLSMLPLGSPGGRLADAVDQVRQGLAGYPGGGAGAAPAVAVMVRDFGWYHAVMAVLASVVAAVFVGVGVLAWRRRGADRRTRRVLGAFGVLAALLGLAALVVAVANTATAADPAPALLAFFKGGW
ncbi:hypothetical protein [Streptacidiphilus cavernicola]|uniref:Tat (Twin-arginine translocation) pathway signal sequence n=1 Tax=Streptacidiphilus cavernicola TaxID=3342716 RepID=A0ABV6VPD9_9ACTN